MKPRGHDSFDVHAFLHSPGPGRKLVEYERGAVIFSQGDFGDDVFFIQKGGVRLSVLSSTGRQGVLALLGSDQFFGEECLSADGIRSSTATATSDSVILAIDRGELATVIAQEPAMSGRLITHLLARSSRLEENLIDQLFNCSEKRLARTLLVLTRYGMFDHAGQSAPPISQETLAEMVGTTRSRVNFFMKKFERLGFIDYSDGLKVNNSLLSVVLRERPRVRS